MAEQAPVMDPRELTINDRVAIVIQHAQPGKSIESTAVEMARLLQQTVSKEIKVDNGTVACNIADLDMPSGISEEGISAMMMHVDKIIPKLQNALSVRKLRWTNDQARDYLDERLKQIATSARAFHASSYKPKGTHFHVSTHKEAYSYVYAKWTVRPDDVLGKPEWGEYQAVVLNCADLPHLDLHPPKGSRKLPNINTQDVRAGEARLAMEEGEAEAKKHGFGNLNRRFRVGAYEAVTAKSWKMSGVASSGHQYNPFKTGLVEADNGEPLGRSQVGVVQLEVHDLFVRTLGLGPDDISVNIQQGKMRARRTETTSKNGVRDSIAITGMDLAEATPSYVSANESFSALSTIFPRPTASMYKRKHEEEKAKFKAGVRAYQELRKEDPDAAKALSLAAAKRVGDFYKAASGAGNNRELWEELVHWHVTRETRYFQHRAGNLDYRKRQTDRNDGFYAMGRIGYEYLMGWGGLLRGCWKDHKSPPFASAFIYTDPSIVTPSFTRDIPAYLKLRKMFVEDKKYDPDDHDEMALLCADLRHNPVELINDLQDYNDMKRLPKEELRTDPRKHARSALPAIMANRKHGPLRLEQLLIIQAHWKRYGDLIMASDILADDLETDPEFAKRLIQCCVYAGKLDPKYAKPVNGVVMRGPEDTLAHC